MLSRVTHPNHARILSSFAQRESHLLRLARVFVDPPEAVVDEARATFAQMIPTMAYLDDPDAAMADNVFECDALLALFLALRERGVGVHDFGRAVIANFPDAEPEPREGALRDARTPRERFEAFIAAGEASARDPKPGRFVFDAHFGDRRETDWSLNVRSCAICHSFGKRGAMDLVPYMCATDDVSSDRSGQGLRRSGTIALGASHCDFAYKRGGEPRRLAELYPERIQLDAHPSDAADANDD